MRKYRGGIRFIPWSSNFG